MENLKNAFENSEAWKNNTAALNDIIDEATAKGMKISEEMRAKLNELRIWKTAREDKTVFNAIADQVFKIA